MVSFTRDWMDLVIKKCIGDAGSTTDIRMLLSAMVCFRLLLSTIVCHGCCWLGYCWLGCCGFGCCGFGCCWLGPTSYPCTPLHPPAPPCTCLHPLHSLSHTCTPLHPHAPPCTPCISSNSASACSISSSAASAAPEHQQMTGLGVSGWSIELILIFHAQPPMTRTEVFQEVLADL